MWRNEYYWIALGVLLPAWAYGSYTSTARWSAVWRSGSLKRDLSLLEVAFLAGGPARVVDTVLVGMEQEGRVVISRAGLVTVTGTDSEHPVEREVIAATGASRSRDLAGLRAAVAGGTAVQGIGDRLEAEGMLISRTLRERHRRARLLVIVAPVVPAAVLALSLVLPAVDDTSDRPLWGAGLALVLVSGFIAGIRFARPKRDRVPLWVRRTVTGFRDSGAERQPHLTPEVMGAAGLTALGLVAVVGVSEVADPELKDALLTAPAFTARQAQDRTGGDGGVGAGWCGSGGGGDAGSGGDSGGDSGCGASACGGAGGSSGGGCGGGSSGCGGGGCGGCGGGGG
ncbi:TIGR04222 domain-containing membrane protein [Kitasatospora sp. NPDC004240]